MPIKQKRNKKHYKKIGNFRGFDKRKEDKESKEYSE